MTASPRPGELLLEDHADGPRHRVALAGEMDIANAHRLLETVETLCAGGAEEVLLDLRELTFVDSTGLRTLAECQRRCAEHGCAFALTPGPPPVQRVFEVAGLLDVFPFRDAG